MPYLCVPIFVTNLAQAKRQIASAIEAGADLVELRIDVIPSADDLIELIRAAGKVLVTCRPTWEGGHSTLDDPTRLDALEAAGMAGAQFIDVELATLRRNPPPLVANGKLIVSSHDFAGRPDRLYNLLAEMAELPADIHKIVWTARTVRDNIEAFEILRLKQRPTIALCMGEAGQISRLLAGKFGGFLSFAAIDSGGGTAAGQVSITDMKRTYRWDHIGPATKVYGVVGSPIAHSMSPAVHNAAFDHTGFDGVYMPLLVNEGYESFKAFMESFLAFAPLDLSGLSVTIPHKENALRYLKERGDQVDELAGRIGAVNTLVITREASGRAALRGFSTDYAAILDTITAPLGITREGLSKLRVAVIGAGGTGRTAVAALAHYGATVVVYNRTFERAQALAGEFDGQSGKVVAARIEKLCDSCCHVYINTTSVGMHPHIDVSPMGDKPPAFTPQTLVFDTIYNPMQTKLLKTATAAGAKTVGGAEMFVRQAAGQFEAWTGLPAPVEIMRNVIEQRLA